MKSMTYNRSKMSSGTRRGRKRKPLLLLFRIASWLVVLGIVWVGYMLWLINSTAIPESLPKADAAIVLGAALWNDQPSPGLKERLDHAYKLYKEGTVDKFILTGGLDHNGSTLTEAEGMRRYLIARGIPQQKLLLEPKATSTYENLLYSNTIAKEEQFKKIIIVTHDYHASRAKDIAEYVGIREPIMAPFESQVLKPVYNETREVLAYSKWMADKVAFRFGWTIKVPEIAYFNK